MNDNRDKFTGIHVDMPVYFRIDRELFNFFRYVPDFKTVDVCERRLVCGQGLLFLIQFSDDESFLHVTAFRFSAA